MQIKATILFIAGLTAIAGAADSAPKVQLGVRSPISFKGSVPQASEAQIQLRLHNSDQPAPYDLSQEKFEEARDRLLQMASSDPTLQQVRLSELPDVSTLKVSMNQERISALGLTTADVNNTLSAAWGGRYVNDFIDRGRVKRVFDIVGAHVIT